MTPDLIQLTLQEILDCACAALAETVCGCPCRAYVAVGDVSWDQCCDGGQLWVKATRVYVTESFPQEKADALICGVGLAADVQVGVLRCAPVLDDQGNPPTPEALTTSSSQVYEDMYALMNSIICCLSATKKCRKFVMRGATSLGPQGGCVGTLINLSIELTDPPC